MNRGNRTGLPLRGKPASQRVSEGSLPITSFEAKKKRLEVNFPSRGKVIKFPSSRKNSLFSNPSFHGKTGHFKGKGKLFSREILPNLPLEGKFCLKRCLGMGSTLEFQFGWDLGLHFLTVPKSLVWTKARLDITPKHKSECSLAASKVQVTPQYGWGFPEEIPTKIPESCRSFKGQHD